MADRILAIFIVATALLSGCQPAAKQSAPAKAPTASKTDSRQTTIRTYFSPDGKTEEAIIAQLAKAKKTIYISMYNLTDEKMANTLIAAKQRGVDVQIVIDKLHLSERYTQVNNLITAGVTIFVSRKPRIMHQKFCVIDSDILITGFLNLTKSTKTSGTEYKLSIHNEPDLCAKYIKEFNDLKAQAEPYKEPATQKK